MTPTLYKEYREGLTHAVESYKDHPDYNELREKLDTIILLQDTILKSVKEYSTIGKLVSVNDELTNELCDHLELLQALEGL